MRRNTLCLLWWEQVIYWLLATIDWIIGHNKLIYFHFVSTGFLTAKGELVRAILYPRMKNQTLRDDIIRNLIFFFVMDITAMIFVGYSHIRLHVSVAILHWFTWWHQVDVSRWWLENQTHRWVNRVNRFLSEFKQWLNPPTIWLINSNFKYLLLSLAKSRYSCDVLWFKRKARCDWHSFSAILVGFTSTGFPFEYYGKNCSKLVLKILK